VLVVTRLLFRDGIRLNGLPAPHAEPSQAPIRPSTLQVDRFTASTQHPQQLNMHHRPTAEWTFRFCFGAKTLVSRPCERCSSALVGGVSSNASERSERSKAVRQLTNQIRMRNRQE